MKDHLKTIFSIFCLALLVGLVSACASARTVASKTAPPQPTVPEPEKYELKTVDFPGPVTSYNLDDLPVFVGLGSLTNDLGQTLEITVTGSTEGSVTDYLKTARIYFEIREPIAIPIVDEEKIELPKLSVRELLKDEKMENLRIDFDLSLDTKYKNPKGSVLVIIDPTVRQNQYNNYCARNPDTDRSDVTITVSQGRVEGTLYRQCAAIAGQTKTASVGIPKTLSGAGSRYFDLVIKGLNAGDNIYRLVGSWNYDYGASVTSEAVIRVTCP